jgi:hypothetical protein
MTFAQALARIEKLQKRAVQLRHEFPFAEIEEIQTLLLEHTNSIVQLGKVAAEMRASVDDATIMADSNDWLFASGRYDKLMESGL